jgi:16S rRNA C1402 (ribose-2'-O) methylase RsmI
MGEVRGELTLVVQGAGPGLNMDSKSRLDPSVWGDELQVLLSQGLSSKEAAAAIATRFNLPRRIVYQAALTIKKA